MKKAILTFAILFTAVIAEAKSGNCKLMIHTSYFDGKKVVDLEEIFAETYGDCKAEAQARRLDTDEEKVATKKVAFGYRAPAVVKEK